MAAPEREVRPTMRTDVQRGVRGGRHIPKRNMEASENAGISSEGGGSTGLHRVDPDRVAQTLGSDRQAAGYLRLELMLNSVLPRLVGEAGSRETS